MLYWFALIDNGCLQYLQNIIYINNCLINRRIYLFERLSNPILINRQFHHHWSFHQLFINYRMLDLHKYIIELQVEFVFNLKNYFQSLEHCLVSINNRFFLETTLSFVATLRLRLHREQMVILKDRTERLDVVLLPRRLWIDENPGKTCDLPDI